MVKQPTDAAEVSASASDVVLNLAAFGHHLRAGNRSPNTITSYTDAVELSDASLADRGMPQLVAAIRREHIEAFIGGRILAIVCGR